MIKFGPSGTGELFIEECGAGHTVDVAKWLKSKNLDCYEYSFGHGLRMGDKGAIAIAEAFNAEEIEISAHAPYFINLNCDDEKVEGNINMILGTLSIAKKMGGKRVVMHPGTLMKNTRADAMAKAVNRLGIALQAIYEHGHNDMMLAVESMGKIAQLGDTDEIIELCRMDAMLVPCIDFGHQHSRTVGGLKTKDDYRKLIDKYIDGLGYEKVHSCHVHFSKQQYSDKGEVRHLTLADSEYGPDYEPLIELIAEYKLEPYIISESAGTQTLDAMALKEYYYKLN